MRSSDISFSGLGGGVKEHLFLLLSFAREGGRVPGPPGFAILPTTPQHNEARLVNMSFLFDYK